MDPIIVLDLDWSTDFEDEADVCDELFNFAPESNVRSARVVAFDSNKANVEVGFDSYDDAVTFIMKYDPEATHNDIVFYTGIGIVS